MRLVGASGTRRERRGFSDAGPSAYRHLQLGPQWRGDLLYRSPVAPQAMWRGERTLTWYMETCDVVPRDDDERGFRA
jgi:hypothetical protein